MFKMHIYNVLHKLTFHIAICMTPVTYRNASCTNPLVGCFSFKYAILRYLGRRYDRKHESA